MPSRGQFKLCCPAFRCLHGFAPPYLAGYSFSDVNKDLGFKAKDLGFKAKAKDLSFKAKDLSFKAKDLSFKAKAKDLRIGP